MGCCVRNCAVYVYVFDIVITCCYKVIYKYHAITTLYSSYLHAPYLSPSPLTFLWHRGLACHPVV
ncbi:hypothetical protein EON63_13355 [archaeon]|nr:MAG: hypothetical protein EON63_13355 [archaeon]